MCTVIYIPTANGYLLSSCRDEKLDRKPAIAPAVYTGRQTTALYPVDAQAGGTWMGLQNNGQSMVLFNGAFEAHVSKPPYAKSRGTIVLALLHALWPLKQWQQLHLDRIEPFSVVLKLTDRVMRLTWDGVKKWEQSNPVNTPAIWSSSTLYSAVARTLRHQYFYDLGGAQGLPQNAPDLFDLLKEAMPAYPAVRYVAKPAPNMATVSISIIEVANNNARFHYWDLVTNQSFITELVLTTAGQDMIYAQI
ncbi:MAG TPA: NRDE family protein [Phnomibacter sp.]|nr:NRDE family protein [Phnomibacter sp.]